MTSHKGMRLSEHLLSYILVPAIIIFSIASFWRFIINDDYIVSYEIACDPMIQDCLSACQDSECTEEYYYAQMQRHAAALQSQCGKDITECEAAQTCFNDDTCSAIYGSTADPSLPL